MAKIGGWSTPLINFADECEEDIKRRIRVIALAMLNEIVLRSPVDTGRFRGNNIVSIGSPVHTNTASLDPGGDETINRGLSVMSGLEPFTQLFLQNNLPYAEKLETGHSKQAPAGIYAVSFNSVSQAYSS